MPVSTSRPPSEGFVGIVLAAGASSRSGPVPKAVVEIDGEPAVTRILKVLRSVGVVRNAVVVGPLRAMIEPLARSEDAETIPNPEWREGRTGSVQLGLEWAEGAEAALLWPVDHPFVEPGTVGRLLEVARGDPFSLWVGPTYRGHGGHPVVIKAPAFSSVRELNADEPLRRVPARLGVQVRRVEVRDPGVLSGTDTLEELERARAEHARARGGAWTVG